ncbi:MAG TPA: glycosyltransferase family 4 protein [Smithellaceae bacterium]|nr:glycosyltransferase family 4 protein [Smithellaceae bacterium]
MGKISILVTSPSLNVADNISGIASMTRLLINNNKYAEYYHFRTGKKDKDLRNLPWVSKQICLPFKFLIYLINNYSVKICHLNVPQENFAIIRDGFLIIVAKLLRKKILVHLHGGKYNRNDIGNYFIKIIFVTILILADKIICLDDTEKTFLMQNYNIADSKIVSLPNAVQVNDVIFKKDYNDILNIVFLGRIEKDKGLDEVITVLKMVHKQIEYKFMLCGTGSYEKHVTDELGRAINNKYINCGVLSGDKKIHVMEQCHIFLLPSYYEGLPNALLEAMAYGVVPICTPVGSIPSVIKDKVNGFLVPLNNSDEIVRLIFYLNNNRDELKKISEAAYEDIKMNYSLADYIKKLNDIYRELNGKLSLY